MIPTVVVMLESTCGGPTAHRHDPGLIRLAVTAPAFFTETQTTILKTMTQQQDTNIVMKSAIYIYIYIL